MLRTVKGQKLMEGAGVRICRTIGVNGIRVDPFLLLDELKLPVAQATRGFPDHPVRTSACKVPALGRDTRLAWLLALLVLFIHSLIPICSIEALKHAPSCSLAKWSIVIVLAITV